MSSRLLRIVMKNEFSTKTIPVRFYYCLYPARIRFENYHSLKRRSKFNIQDYFNTTQFYWNRKFSTSNNQTELDFELVCNETLESLCDCLERIIEENPDLDNPDITFSDGVLTLQLGEPYGTYVINRQSPNKQIWLSSPTSGPKRYDFDGTKWIYKHDGVMLHKLLTDELSKICSKGVNFSECVFSGMQ